MSNFLGRPPFSNSLWVAIETMHFHIAQTEVFGTPSFRIQGVPMNNLSPMQNCPSGLQGNLNWMPGYMCDQQRLRPACAYMQSDQSRCSSLEYFMTVKLLTKLHLGFLSLKRECTGSTEATLVKMQHCWKFHVAGLL